MSVFICVSCSELGVHSWVIIHCVNLTDNSQFCKTYCHTQKSSLHTALHSWDVSHALPLSSLFAFFGQAAVLAYSLFLVSVAGAPFSFAWYALLSVRTASDGFRSEYLSCTSTLFLQSFGLKQR